MTTAASVWIVALTRAGAALGWRLAEKMPGAQVWLPVRLQADFPAARSFAALPAVFQEAFACQVPVVAIMAAGIVVRQVAPLLKGKDIDPGVVVMDELGRFAISLLSGHLGGANELARTVGRLLGAAPVITTATDVQGLPAVDLMAATAGLGIDNLPLVKTIHLAFLEGRRVGLVDPEGFLETALAGWEEFFASWPAEQEFLSRPGPAVYVGCRDYPWPEGWLRLRPKNLVAGMGCNKGTPAAEILDLLTSTFHRFHLALRSLHTIATIAAKQHEPGLLAAAQQLGVNFSWYSQEELALIKVPNPSATVQRHMGVASVSEAAALKAAGTATLLVPKQKSANVTLAVAQAGWRW